MRKTIIEHNGFYQIKTPLPFPLQWVNSYLFREDDEWTLLDPGLHTDDNKLHWDTVLRQLSIPIQKIRRIVLTHHHPDHYGISGWLQQMSGAEVWMSAAAQQQAQVMWGAKENMSKELPRLFVKHGMPEEMYDNMVDHMLSFISQVTPAPQVHCFRPEESFQLGERSYEWIQTGGHAKGHVSFYHKENGILFCGDQILPRISPNISYLPNGAGDDNPLASYLDALHHLMQYKIQIAYPGHRDPFTNVHERLQQLFRHHQERLNRILNECREPAHAYQLCNKLFGTKLSFHQLRFAMSETIAHLVYLQKCGKMEAFHRDSIQYYQSFPSSSTNENDEIPYRF